ncbi:MAG: hypothetical protein ACKOBL_17720 [Chloroflexota bacterium]
MKPSFLKIVLFLALFVLSSWMWSIYVISGWVPISILSLVGTMPTWRKLF